MNNIKGVHGWALLIGLVALVDLLAPTGQTMSEALYSARRNHPILIPLAVLATAGHLLFGDCRWYRKFDIFKIIWLCRSWGGEMGNPHRKDDSVPIRLDWMDE